MHAYIQLISSALVNVRHNGPECRSTVTHPRRCSRTEYCSPIWARSSYTQLVESQRNNCAPLLSGNGTIRPTQLPWLTALASIASPALQRKTAPDVFLCTRHWLIRNGQATSTASTTHAPRHQVPRRPLWTDTQERKSRRLGEWGPVPCGIRSGDANVNCSPDFAMFENFKHQTACLCYNAKRRHGQKMPHGVHQHAMLCEKFNFLLGKGPSHTQLHPTKPYGSAPASPRIPARFTPAPTWYHPTQMSGGLLYCGQPVTWLLTGNLVSTFLIGRVVR